MRVLIISDYIQGVSCDNYEYHNWESSRNDIPALEGYDVVLIDMTFDEKKSHYLSRDLLLYDLNEELKRKDFLDINSIVMIVICASDLNDISLDILEENRTDRFDNYGFLYHMFPFTRNNIAFKKGNLIYPVARQPIVLYLDRYKHLGTYIKYTYDSKEDSVEDIIPLAKMKETSDTYAAFECSKGKGKIVILTPYDINDIEKASALIQYICRSYYKRKIGLKDISKINTLIPSPVRENMIEAIGCYNNDFFKSSIIMCRKTLESSAMDKGIKEGSLKKTIEMLFVKGIINSKMKEVAEGIRGFGNMGAHEEREITESMTTKAINFMEYYLDYVYVLNQRLENIKKTRNYLI